MAAASPALRNPFDNFKTSLANWLLSHGQAGRVAMLVGGVLFLALTQAQNIEAGFRMVGRLLGFGRKPVEPPPEPPSETTTASVEVSGTSNTTFTGVHVARDLVVNQMIHQHTQTDPDPKIPGGRLQNLPSPPHQVSSPATLNSSN